MKLIILSVLAVVALVSAAPAKKSTYTTRYDGINLDQILNSDRLLNNYLKCLLETGRCTPDGSELKRSLPDALKTDCTKCSDAQRQGSDRVVRFLIKNKPAQWDSLQKKYDPENLYKSRHPEIFQ